MRREWSVVVVGVGLVAAAVSGWWWWRAAPVPAGSRPEVTSGPGGHPPLASSGGGAAGSTLRTRRFSDSEPHADPPAPGAAPPVPAELHRTFDSTVEAERFVEDRVLELLLALEPGLDPTTLAHACSDDGRHCSFEGPWLGDDLTKRWVRAIAEGRTSLETMQGVRFSGLSKQTRPDGREVFVIGAHAP
jgi:hypothetical protein